MLTKEVRIGERVVTVEAFSTRRTTHVGKAAAALFKRYGGIQDDMAAFRKTYGEKYPRRITRDMCEDAAANFHDRATAAAADGDEEAANEYKVAAGRWERRLQTTLKDREYIELPGEPAFEDMLVEVLPNAIENAEEEVARLLGLLVLSNENFAEVRKEARRAGQDEPTLADRLLEEGDTVLDDSSDLQVIDLIQAGAELLLEDMETRRERVGKLKAVFEKAFPKAAKALQQEATKEEQPEGESQSPDSDSAQSSEATSDSSTDSPDDTDGQPSEHSTPTPTERLSTSPT